MKNLLFLFISFLLVITMNSCSDSENTLKSGVSLNNMDTSVRAEDDFYSYVNGTWLKETEIPEDSSSYSTFKKIYDDTQLQLKEIIQNAAQNSSSDVDEQKMGDLYKSYMDEASLQTKDLTPIQNYLDEIASVNSRSDLVKIMSKLYTSGSLIPFEWDVYSDSNNSTQNIVYLNQSGTALPSREYYLSSDASFVQTLQKYQTYVSELMELANFEDTDKIASDIVTLEKKLADIQWSNEENRDTLKTYNKMDTKSIDDMMESFDFTLFLENSNLQKESHFIVTQPSYFQDFSKVYAETSLAIWKEYLSFELINAYANLLSDKFETLHFAFYQTQLQGIETEEPRWKRAVGSVNEILGDIVGKKYVAHYFPVESKEKISTLVDNLIESFDSSIDNLSWMSAKTKEAARAKLHKITTKIGYPQKWKDYSSLQIKEDDLVGNYMRASQWYFDQVIAKLEVPVDRSEWFMTPQTVNAYYDPSANNIVFPAAILQPPFFDADIDSAVNYGAIGAVIGHELSHAFDDNGAKYDGDGNLHNWWSDEDAIAFKALGDRLVKQYDTYEPIEGIFINGQLTLGENMADLNGVTIAYDAYIHSLQDREAPILDGFTGKQRFFIAWAQIWRGVMREEEVRKRLVTDPHSPKKYRVIGVLSNVEEFYKAFDVNVGDGMYIEKESRIKMW